MAGIMPYSGGSGLGDWAAPALRGLRMTTSKKPQSDAFRNRKPRKRIRKGRRPVNAMRYREHLAALGLNQVEAAAFLEVDERTSRRYANGEGEVPRPIAYLLSAMVKYNLTVQQLEALVEESWRT